MANNKLGKDSVTEIRRSMVGLSGANARQMAEKLAELHGVNYKHIYKLTSDLRPKSKTRSDKGNRSFEIVEGSDIYEAVKLYLGGKLTPELALMTAKANGFKKLPSLAYFQQILRENGIGKTQLRKHRRGFRFWEAEFPGEIIQIDVTALKVRWEDEKTRRILRIEGIDKNHPQLDESKVRVWQIMATDDHSRRRFLRYVATTHITSRLMVEFCIELFEKWGVPEMVYSDNGSEFKGYFIRAEKILNSILENQNGFLHKRHQPGNAQASGKVEVAHKWAEQMDKLVGVAINKGLPITIEQLNPFADNLCHYYNGEKVQRATKQTPDARWFSKRILVRKLPRKIIESALLADEFTATLNPSMCVSHKGVMYRIPGQQPFVNFKGSKIDVVIPLEIDLMLVKLPGETNYHEIEKVIAVADKAGKFKSVAESKAEKLIKEVKSAYKADNKEAKKTLKQTGEEFQVPFYNHEIESTKTNITPFPHKETTITPEEIAAVTPIPAKIYQGKQLSYWEAVGKFADEFESAKNCREFLRPIFADDDTLLPHNEVEEIIKSRDAGQVKHLRAIS